MLHGVDVSSYQSANYPIRGQDFAFVKVTEGMSYTNPRWVAQRDHARSGGLVVGYYHFVTPGSMSAQADRFLGKIALREGDILALDWEHTGVPCADKDRWIARVRDRARGHRVVLYCNRDFWFHRDTTGNAGDGLWIADPAHAAGRPGVQHAWTFHQYDISGGIDRNVAHFSSRADLRAWARRRSLQEGELSPE